MDAGIKASTFDIYDCHKEFFFIFLYTFLFSFQCRVLLFIIIKKYIFIKLLWNEKKRKIYDFIDVDYNARKKKLF
jgi:hypothetical protein